MADTKSIFDLDEFKPYRARWEERRTYFQKWERYYEGTMYAKKKFFGLHKIMASNVEALFEPLARAVALDVALVPGGWRLDAASRDLEEPLRQLFRQSRWRLEGSLYVHNGAMMGHSMLKVVDDRMAGQVRLQALRPDTVLPIATSSYSRELAMAIIIGQQRRGGEMVEVAEVIEPERIRTFVAGTPTMVAPDRGAEFANLLGFVPIVECRFIESGQKFGEPTFKRSAKALDKVNEQASYLSLIIKRHAEPQWAVIGDVEPTDLEKSGEDVWFIPGGADVKAIVAQIDIDGVRQFVGDILEEMKDSLPELNVSKLVGVQRIAAATIELQMSEATAKIRRIRDSVDTSLADAVRMAGRAAATMREQGELAVLDDPMLEFDRQRRVFDLDALTRLQIETAENAVQMGDLSIRQQQALDGDGFEGDGQIAG